MPIKSITNCKFFEIDEKNKKITETVAIFFNVCYNYSVLLYLKLKWDKDMKKDNFLECGIIINTHGVSGELKLESFCDTPKILAGFKTLYFYRGGEYVPVKMLHASVFKSFVIAKLEGVDDMDKAIALKNTTLYASRKDFKLPKDSYFIADLIGLDVIDNISGRVYGKIVDVQNKGASDIYVVKTPEGERMMPAVKEFVKKTDIEKGVYVEVIPGMLYD